MNDYYLRRVIAAARTGILLLAALTPLALWTGCKKEARNPPPKQSPTVQKTTTAPPVASQGWTGKVLETMDAASYTYIHVETPKEKIWAAAPQFKVKVGDKVTVPPGAPMPNFNSKTLNRTFELIYFVGAVGVGDAAPGGGTSPEMPVGHDASIPGHPPIQNPTDTGEKIDLAGIAKAEGGHTVAELFAGKDALAGKQVQVRGKVVKYSAGIMGKNWIHLQDGTGDAEAKTNDLVITTDAEVQVGDLILVTGALTKDKNFGFGYKYAAIIEDAKIEPQTK